MESWRPRSPETSSSDEDRNPKYDHDSGTTTAKRSYECTFCKRGFTNAQALGGHMNIHRKDRAQAKQLTSTGTNYNNNTSSSINSNNYHYSSEDHHHHYVSMSYDKREPISSQGASGYYPVLDQRNYQMYFQPSDDSSLGSRSNESLGMNQELWGANLSLQFGPNHLEDDGYGRGVRRSDDVDLELRLGHG